MQRPFIFDKELEDALTEISTSNEDAFREILRMEPLPGHTKPRLAYSRNFFGSLEDMARYWDSSKDSYYQVPASKDSSRSSQPHSMLANHLPQSESDDSAQSNQTDSNGDTNMSDSDHSTTETKEVYKGYRFGNGEQLNPGSRVALVKNLLKMVVHKFGCRDHEPMPAPREKLIVRGVKVQSIQYHFGIARIPKESKLARARMVEGPILAVHVREEIRFKQDPKLTDPASALADKGPESKLLAAARSRHGSLFIPERFDLFREVGALLILATQRAREGKSKDSFSGNDKWWVSQQRWGGATQKWGDLATEIYEDEDPSWSPAERELQEQRRQQAQAQAERLIGGDAAHTARVASTLIDVDAMIAKNAPLLPTIPGEPISEQPRRRKLRSLDRPPGKEEEMRDGKRLVYVPPFKKKWYTDWQRLKANTPTWDDKVIYQQIGKKPGSDFDDLYMVTSVNHHVALVRMEVHKDYLAWLETGNEVSDEPLPDGRQRNILYVKRGEWYDMFDIEARKEFLTAIWRLMCWLNRDHIDPSDYPTKEQKHTDGQQG